MSRVRGFRPAPLTRRRFLEQLGAIGGSSLVMTAMSSMELMADGAGERPQLTGKPGKARVLVLGCGISGLVVGYELAKLGYDFQMLEARDRVGGLAWTVRRGSEHTEADGGERQVCTWDEGQYVNVGPWRIPHSHTGVLNYCREVGVPLQIFLNESESQYVYYEGDAIGPLAGRKLRVREVRADLQGQINELLIKAIDQHRLDSPLTVEDQDRLANFLVSQGYLDSTDRRYKAFNNRGPGDPHDLAALLQSGFGNRIRSVSPLEGTVASPMFQPVGGMDQLPKGLARAIGSNRIALNAEVQSVHQDDRGVKVVYANSKNGKKTEIAADYVVICLPLNILANIDINVSEEMMTAIKAVPYSSSAKIGLAMKRRFWEEDDGIFGGHLYSNLPLGEFSYPSNDYFTKKGVLLGLYANQPVADLLDRPVAARIEHVLTHASKVHPQIRQEFESGYAVFWKKVKYNLGGFATGAARARRPQLTKVENRLIIGSAATAPHSEPDWQEGAVAAGWQALTSLHERAMRSSSAGGR